MMKKRLLQQGLVILTSAIIMICAVGITASAQATADNAPPTGSPDSISMTRADIIETYLREYNGMLQKRRWNATRGYWLDADWVTISM